MKIENRNDCASWHLRSLYCRISHFPDLLLHQQWCILLQDISNSIRSHMETSLSFPVAKRNISCDGWWNACHIFPHRADRLILGAVSFITKIKPNENISATVKCGRYMIIKHVIPPSFPPQFFSQFTPSTNSSFVDNLCFKEPKQMNDLIAVQVSWTEGI